jgi:hypothetical protein
MHKRLLADFLAWQRGSHEIKDVVVIPAEVPGATYSLHVAILAENADASHNVCNYQTI